MTEDRELKEDNFLIPGIFLREDAGRTKEIAGIEEAVWTGEAAQTDEAAWTEEAEQTEEAACPSSKQVLLNRKQRQRVLVGSSLFFVISLFCFACSAFRVFC